MRLPPLALAAAAALAAAGCSTSPCQDLGEKLCACTGLSSDTCKTQVEQQLNKLNPTQPTLDRCQALLDSCHEPANTTFCDWIKTQDGQVACGLAQPDPANLPTTAP